MSRASLVAAVCGALMALALAIGGLTRPEVVIGWVDFLGAWDPTMLVFFAFGVSAYHLMLRWARARADARRGPELALPASQSVDRRLVLGPIVFGVGWGFGGVCPGPGLTSLGAGATWAIEYVVAMLIGFALFEVTAWA